MKSASLFARISPILIVALFTPPALAQSDCSADMAEFDRRIATGDYPAEDVQFARQLQASYRQMCTFMDNESRVGLRESIEEILPARTEEAASGPRGGPVLLTAPTARSLSARVVARDEPMNQFSIWDWDVINGRLRVLYSSFPNTAQFGLPDWRFNVYVTEITAAGSITHRLITSKQAVDHAGLMLRRGFDEVLLQRQVDRPGEPAALERWSVNNPRMLATVDISGRTLSLNDEAWRSGAYPIATSDGNILYVARKIGTRQDDGTRIGWFKFSPGGAQLGSGTAAAIKDDFDIWSSFHTTNGGAGLIVNIIPGAGSEAPANDVAAAFGMLGNAASGKRAMIVDGNANLAFTSTAIEGNRPTTPAATAETTQSQAILLAVQFSASRTIVSNNVGPHRIDVVKETGRGYAYLAEVIAGGDDNPPSNGPYLIEFDASGESNEIYLQAIAETLNITVANFAPSPDGHFYVFGHDSSGDSHVVLIDRDGNPLARSRTSYNSPTKIADIVADASGVWLLGHTGYGSDRGLWLERIEMGSE